MKLNLFILLLSSTLFSNSALSAHPKDQCFTENKGQISDQYYKPRPDVLFSGNTNPRYLLQKGRAPKNLLDHGAYRHDVNYFDNGYDGIQGAILGRNSINADFTLARTAFNSVGTSDQTKVRSSVAYATFAVFNILAGTKYVYTNGVYRSLQHVSR